MSDMLTVRLHVQFREDGVGKAWLEAESLRGMWHTTPIKTLFTESQHRDRQAWSILPPVERSGWVKEQVAAELNLPAPPRKGSCRGCRTSWCR